jgi:dihydroorotase-like cyclic amidohydrolase
MPASQTLIRGGLVLVDNARFAPVSLLVQDGLIADIFDEADPLADGLPDRVTIIDATDRIIIPGLVNGHPARIPGPAEQAAGREIPRSVKDRQSRNGAAGVFEEG